MPILTTVWRALVVPLVHVGGAISSVCESQQYKSIIIVVTTAIWHIICYKNNSIEDDLKTHYPYCAVHTPDVIDIAVICGINVAVYFDVLDEHLISDHQNWRVFADYMTEHSPFFPVESPTEVDRPVTDLSAVRFCNLRNESLTRRSQGGLASNSIVYS